jgi:plastocyanin
MTSKYVLIGIVIGVFFAGLGIGYALFINTYNPYALMMGNPTMFSQMMGKNPQFSSQYMGYMTQNPQYMNQWMSQNPQYMGQWMGSMMQDPQLRQHMYNYMLQNQDFMYGMMGNTTFQNNWMYPYMKNNWKMGSGMMYNGSSSYPMMSSGGMMGSRIPFNWSQQLGNPVQTDQVIIPNEAWNTRTGSHFVPYYIEVKTGTKVTWTNKDNLSHTVTSDQFDSNLIQPGQSWSYTFSTAGQYDYYCTLHPWMKGVVKVQ